MTPPRRRTRTRAQPRPRRPAARSTCGRPAAPATAARCLRGDAAATAALRRPARAAGGGYSPVAAIQYGWAKFTKSPSTLLVPVLVLAAVVIVLEIIGYVIMNATLLGTGDCTITVLRERHQHPRCGGPGFFTTLFDAPLIGLVCQPDRAGPGAGADQVRAECRRRQGGQRWRRDLLRDQARGVTTAAILAVATFDRHPAVLPARPHGRLPDRVRDVLRGRQGARAGVDAIKASICLVTSKIGETILFYVLGVVVIVVGAILCLVGLLAAIPVVVAGAAYTFRVLNDEPVTPAA